MVAAICAVVVYDTTSPIHDAVRAGDVARVMELVDQNPDLVNERRSDEFHESPLSIAITQNDEEMVKLLLNAGADVNYVLYGGKTPLSRAARSGHIGIAKLLIENGAEINPTVPSWGTPLISAAESRSPALVQLLLERGADANAVHRVGRGMYSSHMFETPLKAAAELGRVESIKLLLDYGAEVNFRGPNDDAAIHMVMRGGNTSEGLEVLRLLLSKGARINERGFQGKTALHLAAAGTILYDPVKKENFYKPMDSDVVDFLIKEGADIDATDDNDMTPLQYAQKNGNIKIANLLIKRMRISVD